MSLSYKELIKQRKSVRTFDGTGLKKEHLAELEKHIVEIICPFDANITFRILDANKNNLSSPVIVGADTYLAAKVERNGQYELAYGYCFEEACLYAASMGIGTVMLAASLSRQTFEKAMDVKENEVMPVASPIGYPAAKRSIRESLMRKGLKADERIAFESLFFDETFDCGLTRERAGDFAEPLEMMRLAPSAANKQPWMAVVCGRAVHFYENRTMKVSPLGDIQKVDIGIGLAHFDLTRKENGLSGGFTFKDPGMKTPENVHYVVSFEKD